MKAAFRNWLAAILVGMAGMTCAAQEVLTPALFINPDSTDFAWDAIAIVGDRIITGVSVVEAVYSKSNPTNLLGGFNVTSDTNISDLGGQVGNDRVIVARDGGTFEIKQASDYSGSYGSVAFGGSDFASDVTRGFTNALGELEAYTRAVGGGGQQFYKMNFTTETKTALPIYGTQDLNARIQGLEAYQPALGVTRFVYPAPLNGTNFITDDGILTKKDYVINFPTNLTNVTITDLAFDPDSTKLYFCFTSFNSSISGGIGVIENFPRQPPSAITNNFLTANTTLHAAGAEPGSRVYLHSATNAAGPYTIVATNDVPLNQYGTDFDISRLGGRQRFFRTSYAP